jgi:hypothetical protein
MESQPGCSNRTVVTRQVQANESLATPDVGQIEPQWPPAMFLHEPYG